MKTHQACGKTPVFLWKTLGKTCGKLKKNVESSNFIHTLWKTPLFFPQVFHRKTMDKSQ
jgi:hypothetical protein